KVKSPVNSMSSWPLQTSFHLRFPPTRLLSSGAHSEFTVRETGENVLARSRVSSEVRHFWDSRGGPSAAPDSIRLVIRQRPGSMPSADASEVQNKKPTAVAATVRTSM